MKAYIALFCFIGILGIFSADILTPNSIRLGALYLFPIFIVGYHIGKNRTTRFILLITVICQVSTLLSYDIPALSKLIESIIKPVAIYLVFILSSNLRKTHLKIIESATKDSMTGLLNNKIFHELLEQEIIRQRRYGGSFSLIFIDLDNFKKLNDTFGHPVGDEALCAIADILRASTRKTDYIGRLGGDEVASVTNQC
jgi:predicted signal transduction protein with EAL and GGDEF domain